MSRRTARLFKYGGSQAVRLPRGFRLEGEEVFVRMEGDTIILSPKPKSWKDFFNKTPVPSEDFMQDRVDLPPQHRKGVS